MTTKSKVIQVPVGNKLLGSLDEISRKRGQSRAALIREACELLVKRLEDERLDREYAEAYRRMPETEEERAWAEMGAEQLAQKLAEDNW